MEDMYSLFELQLNSIELLGYSKNNIFEAEDKVSNIPQEYREKLRRAYSLLDEVQEYLFNH